VVGNAQARDRDDCERRDAAEQDRCAEYVEEQRKIPRVRSEESDHSAPGFQIITARIAKTSRLEARLSASGTGSRTRAWSSALGVSPPRAARPASCRVAWSRLPAWPPSAPESAHITSAATIQPSP